MGEMIGKREKNWQETSFLVGPKTGKNFDSCTPSLSRGPRGLSGFDTYLTLTTLPFVPRSAIQPNRTRVTARAAPWSAQPIILESSICQSIMTSDPAGELSLLSLSEDLVPSPIRKPSQEVTLAFEGLLNPPLILQTNETECGGKLWPAGMVLAEYLLLNKMDEVQGKEMFVRSFLAAHACRNSNVTILLTKVR